MLCRPGWLMGNRPLTASVVDLSIAPSLLGKNQVTSGTSLALTTLQDINIGDSIVIHTGSGTGSTNLTGVVDSGATNVYTVQLAETQASGIGRAICQATAFLAAGSTITASFASSAARHAIIGTKVKNLAASPVAETPASTGTTGTSTSIASGTMTFTPQLVIGAIMWAGSDPGTLTPGTGWSADSTLNASCFLSVVYKVVLVAAGDTFAPSWVTSRAFRANCVGLTGVATLYDFTDSFASVADSTALTQTLLPTVYPSVAISAFAVPSADDSMAGIFSIVNEAAATSGRGMRTKYPAGSAGELFWFSPTVPTPDCVANLEYMFRFESGFQLNPDPAMLHSGGKTGIAIDHTSTSAGALGGTRAQWWWLGDGSDFPAPKITPILQTSTGGELVNFTGAAWVVGTNYKLRFKYQGGPSGFVQYYVNDVLIDTFTGSIPNTVFSGSHLFRHTGFAGGAGVAYEPTIDCFTTIWNVHAWGSSS